MPNSRRFHLPDFPQHVVQRGNNGQACFAHDEDFAEYLNRLAAAALKYAVAVHAYALMSNHVHLLVTPATPDGVGRMMQATGCGYVRAFNSRCDRTGTLWDGRYFSCLVGTDAYLWNCYRYIELNPVRAGIVPNPGAYPWSSHAANAYGHPDRLISPHPILAALPRDSAGGRPGYRELFECQMDESLIAEIRESLQKERAFGNEAFLAAVEAAAVRSPRCRTRGRPRKLIVNDPASGAF